MHTKSVKCACIYALKRGKVCAEPFQKMYKYSEKILFNVKYSLKMYVLKRGNIQINN
jgi:hypothetical protein